MPILAITHIHINGNQLPYYNSCSLHQEIGKHHILELHCFLETIQDFCNDNNQEIEDLLGTIVTIETKSYADLDFHGMLKFKGIITGLNYRKGLHSGSGNFVLITAKSPTIIADDGPHHKSFSEMSFVDIIKDNFTNYDTSKLKINTNNSKLTKPLTYTVQSNESCFEFAQRIAARNGEWLYYNGEELVFGLDKSGDDLELILGRDLQDFNTSLTPIPQNFEYYTNDYLTDDVHETPSSKTASSSEGNFGVINDNSKELYTNPTRIWVNLSDDANSKNRLDNHAELQQTALQTNQVKVNGTSDNPGVLITTTIKINERTYRVTKVTHSYSNNGEYENFFEATSASIDAYPNTNVNAFPMAKSQTATVIDNHDPDGLGRVKVQFAWQRPDSLTTPWIRLVTAHAGNGKGFYMIPEKDEEVIVNFEGGNAEVPYVTGSFYNSNAKPPEASSNANNDIKILQTKSGSSITFDDEKGSITFKDKAGSSIVLDGSGNISISASSVSINGSDNAKINSKSVTVDGTDAVNIGSEATAISASGKTIGLTASTEVSISGKTKVTISSDAEATMTGLAKATVSSSGATSIEGTIIKLN